MQLGRTAQASRYRVEAFESLGSTNDEAMARGRAGDHGRLWIVAREQGQGRGRNGRVWSSPPGNLYCSLLLRTPCQPALAPQIGFVAGVALHRAVSAVSALSPGRLALKWPNDLLLDRAKLAGILVEGSMAPGGDLTVVIGIGVNAAHNPADTPYPATNLGAKGLPVGVSPLFAALSDTMAETLARWDAGRGFQLIRREWLERAGGLGEAITVRRPDGDRRGIFVDLDPDGRLLLDEGTRRVAIEAGDVFLTALQNEFQ
ncbi:biotin--[acetyl-CoA-carboxylase] ligase [Alsobacter metallidurans]|uniref:biotin--[biotin carboxyl-carrier protein] ligase n=1 Tax=Alsobacter metallidurans TaxID=340221 RepID=A0A917MHZ0_9HYPH|nr:biotin--[acetyl-CoA-carboxylase] ligase [Alsobacter metallidurans]GGH20555.1 biotin--[acetyl-CoA-carboxylase] ligase [Alsobacter metallidurans]